jgi:hypothetical protein
MLEPLARLRILLHSIVFHVLNGIMIAKREREKQAKGEGTTKEPKARRSSAKQISTRKKISKTIQRRKDVDDEDDGAERGANIYHSRMLSHVLFMAAFRASGLITKDVEVKEQQLFV